MDKPTHICNPTIWRPTEAVREERHVAREIPLALEYNCISHAVMMISPFDVEDFCMGFSLTEGIIDRPDQIMDLTIIPDEKGLIAAVEITPDCFKRLDEFKRTLAGRTGCGLCGVDRLDHAIRPLKPVISPLKVSADIVHSSMNNLSDLQIENKKTGALHAAAFVTSEGEIITVREDIGRHNALDKLIGHMMRNNINPAEGFALITSRCSFEMVHKCATFGIPLLAAVSATTDLALKLAEEADLTLIAFARRNGMNIYCDPQKRLIL